MKAVVTFLDVLFYCCSFIAFLGAVLFYYDFFFELNIFPADFPAYLFGSFKLLFVFCFFPSDFK